ncbi:putative phospholipid-transporting ATPase VD [Lamellibrachia satsuma]|nr:putative phospholipid-transporting ATPase VD [Lamellibrachia satsuma]
MGNIIKKNSKSISELNIRQVVPNHLVSDDVEPRQHPNAAFLTNAIKTTKYTVFSFLPRNLFEQFHRFANMYFLFIVLLNWMPHVNAFTKEVAMIPVLFVLSVTAVKDGYEDYRRYKSDKKVNHLPCRVYSRVMSFTPPCLPTQQNANYQIRRSTSSTGPWSLDWGEKIGVTQNNLLLRECVIRNTDFVEGIVVYAGHETKALLNNNGPRYKRSKLECRLNRDVIWCVLILLLMCLYCSLGSGFWMGKFADSQRVPYIAYSSVTQFSPTYRAFITFWTYIILFQVMIPLSLYITVELVKLGQIYFITNDLDLYDEASNKRILCRALNINEDLGQVDYVFSDKTGTLTEKSHGAGTPEKPQPEPYSEGIAQVDDVAMMQIKEETDGIPLNPTLQQEVSSMTFNSGTEVQFNIPVQSRRISDFFLLLTICNTVVVSHDHIDKMDASGVVHEDEDTTERQKKQSERRQKVRQQLKKFSQLFTGGAGDISHEPLENSYDENDGDDGYGTISDSPKDVDTGQSEESLKTHYEAESPDELALVKAGSSYGCHLVKRSANTVTLALPGDGQVPIKVLHILPFDATRRRMSVIIEHPVTHQVVLLVKGADSAIFNNLATFQGDADRERIHRDTMEHLTNYAKEGLRTLCMASRVLSPQEYEKWLGEQALAESSLEHRDALLSQSACKVETKLELLGATGIEDKLQEGVPETIAALREAGINVWVLTGDKQETALNIAYSCQLISFDQELICLTARNKDSIGDLLKGKLEHIERLKQEQVVHPGGKAMEPIDRQVALVVDGKTLGYVLEQNFETEFLSLTAHCNSVLCCRATPFQKAAVVKLVRDHQKKLTCAVGDGANDVSMLQMADVGIGISGQEGMQAVMASDFALPRFYMLRKLLLVHGHWCYDRLARMILFMFYKNAVFVFLLMWFQMFSGFSGSIMVDELNLIFFNIFYTSLPPLVLGIFDKNAPGHILEKEPQLYKQGPLGKVYKKTSYIISILDALWQSLVLFFVPYFAYVGSNTGLQEFGFTCNTACVFTTLLHISSETHSWGVFHWLGLFISCATYLLFNLVFDSLCVSCLHPSDPYWVSQHSLANPVFWFTLLIATVVALSPRLMVHGLMGSLRPSGVVELMQQKKMKRPPCYQAKWSSLEKDSVTIEKYKVYRNETEA